ncbi:GtrA family protein [Olivibacter sp. XZL3]|uniref:GtrA family protein n=1 Tax=Olivibacter sp. XZL3 TaxID=1735116 RepID=UPI00106683F6|nr:GtrA family protein [Olivibacter sp. XZL3]
MLKKSSIYTFIKAQFSAFLGGIVDYSVMVICTELLYIHYTISIIVGGMIGALINFMVNLNWTFKATARVDQRGGILIQLAKFASMVGGSVLLKSSGTYLLTETVQMDYRIGRIVVDLLVSLGFNYTLQRYWVFKRNP